MSNTQTRTARQIIDAANDKARTSDRLSNGWGERHYREYRAALGYKQGLGAALVRMLEGAAGYADAHAMQYDSRIGFDYVLGEAFANILQGVRAMLNGELGHLDAGTLDGIICAIASENGINPDTWELGYTPTSEAR